MVSAELRRAFYDAASLGLRALEARPGGPRRFGAEADSRWSLFKGELGDADRLDFYLRDAATPHPAAFAPRVVFALEGLTADEPFGPAWEVPDLGAVHGWLRAEAPADLPALLAAVARAWRLTPAPRDAAALSSLTPADRFAVAGAGAIIAAACSFDGRQGYDLADQAVLITDRPGERQLFGIAAACLGASRGLRILAPAAAVPGPDLPTLRAAFVSDDASPASRAAAARLAP